MRLRILSCNLDYHMPTTTTLPLPSADAAAAAAAAVLALFGLYRKYPLISVLDSAELLHVGSWRDP